MAAGPERRGVRMSIEKKLCPVQGSESVLYFQGPSASDHKLPGFKRCLPKAVAAL